MSEYPSLEEQAAMEGYEPSEDQVMNWNEANEYLNEVDPAEYQPDEEPADDFPIDEFVEVGPPERKWTVIDSEGHRHTIEADHIGHSVKGYITFWNPVTDVISDMVAAFYNPVGVFPEKSDEHPVD